MDKNKSKLDDICDEVAEKEFPEMGGLSGDTIYTRYAKSVANYFLHEMVIVKQPYEFPEFSPETTSKQVKKRWYLDRYVPWPRYMIPCPSCRSIKTFPKHWVYFKKQRSKSLNPYRCDAHMKCKICSMVWQHGVVVPESMHPGPKMRYVITWRDVDENGYKRE